MADTPVQAVPLDENLPCPKCSYNLRGLESGTCPECGTPFTVDAVRRLLKVRSGRFAFWRRQFLDAPTTWQDIFDFVFGIAMPAVCLVFDPFIFVSSDYRGAIYAFLVFEMVMLVLSRLVRGKLAMFDALAAGVLAVGDFAAFATAVCLLPFSIIGLLVGIGLLGFTPLLTSFVFGRNAIRSYWAAQSHLQSRLVLFLLLLAALATISATVALDEYLHAINHPLAQPGPAWGD